MGVPWWNCLCPQRNAWPNISALQAVQNCNRFHRAQILFGREFLRIGNTAENAQDLVRTAGHFLGQGPPAGFDLLNVACF